MATVLPFRVPHGGADDFTGFLARLRRIFAPIDAAPAIISLIEDARANVADGLQQHIGPRTATTRAAACTELALERLHAANPGLPILLPNVVRELCRQTWPAVAAAVTNSAAHHDEQASPLRAADSALRQAAALHNNAGDPTQTARLLACATGYLALAMEELT
jgi:hypothetical protein